MTTSMKLSGVYTITNTVSGRVYVGKSLNIPVRFRAHKRKLSRGNHENVWLQRAWLKYGESAFVFEIVLEMPGASPLEIALAEGRTGELYDKKYNVMVITKEGQFSPPSVRQKIGAATRQRMMRPEARLFHSSDLKARWADPEHRQIRVEALTKAWQDPAVKAARVAATMAGQAKAKEDPNSKINQRYAKRWAAADARLNASSKSTAQWADPEMKAKMRAALKAGWARRKAKAVQSSN